MTPDRDVRAHYRNEFGLLDMIAVYVSNSRHGSFLKAMAYVWQMADPSNKRILKPSWRMLIQKYGLDEEYERARGEVRP